MTPDFLPEAHLRITLQEIVHLHHIAYSCPKMDALDSNSNDIIIIGGYIYRCVPRAIILNSTVDFCGTAGVSRAQALLIT